VAIDSQYTQYAPTITKHFNSVTAENEMKFDALQPTEGNFTFDTADRMVDFATSNGMQVRGHALVWHNQTPSWVFSGSREQVLERMRNHIQTVMQHFEGKVQAWDVVNEAIMDDGSFRGENGGSGWYEALGESFIAEAFRAARDADPTAKLYYNDYANYTPARRQGIYDLLASLVEDGVPIDGVGLQGHMHLEPGANHEVIRYQTVDEMETAISMYSSLGLDVQITEVDVSMYVLGEQYDTFHTPENVTPELFEQQAQRYREFFELFRKHSDLISSVTLWGLVDNNTWLSEFPSGQEDFPLLFDAQQQPKPAFWALVDFCN
jgi:endo-1,4-beta-xylanase